MATVQPFLHEPLPSPRYIRLLSLGSSTDPNAEICCTVFAVDLDNLRGKDPYEALSYVWGSPTGTIPIHCNDKELLVTPNLYDALRRLRRRFSSRVLWIDAICIDQRQNDRSTQERNIQVEMMGEIYREARTVLIWLGVGDKSTPRAFGRIRAIGMAAYCLEKSRLDKTIVKLMLSLPTYYIYGDRSRGPSTVNAFEEHRQDVRIILNNPWFLRVWTFQEAAFARRCLVLCGKMRLDWHILQAAMDYVCYVDIDSKRAGAHQNDKPEFEHNDDMWAKVIGHLDSSLPQDKVYGLYPVLKTLGFDLKRVEYGNTISQIYGDAAKAFIKREPCSLSILCLSIRPFGYDELPTWVPNWATGHPHFLGHEGVDFTGHYLFRPGVFHASGNSIAAMPRPYPQHELHVKGVIIGRVSRRIVSPSTAEASNPAQSSTRIVDFIRVCRNFMLGLDQANLQSIYKDACSVRRELIFAFAPEIATGPRLWQDSRLDSWFDILRYPNCGDLPTSDMETVAALEHSDVTGEHRYLEIIERVLDQNRLKASREHLPVSIFSRLNMASLFYHKWCLRLSNWSFLFIDTGHIGRAYFNSREGDSVALLAGSEVPFLLRVADEQDRYQVVAPAYICGMMQGQLWPEDNETGVKEITLV
ncbi:heterokaryon incompatibility protein-domain-containing protein [Hypoxylon argillaceum]|nr:heterokaryon incompatibility protein-domain-containing protein [Hypoxylon argillaceum]